jgi:hypothetical protein
LFSELTTNFQFSVLLETLESGVPKSFDVFLAPNLYQPNSVSFGDFFLQCFDFFYANDFLILSSEGLYLREHFVLRLEHLFLFFLNVLSSTLLDDLENATVGILLFGLFVGPCLNLK